MKALLVTVIVAAGLAGSTAMAADMRSPVYKAPVVPRVSDWSGPYIGGHFGYDWGRTRVIDNGVLTESGAPTNGVIGGLLAGMNWQSGLFVYGLEVDFGVASIRGIGNVGPPPAPPQNSYVVGMTGDVRGRLGYVILPSTLIFAAGGLAVSGFEFQHSASGQNFGTIFPGWTIGGGIDQMFTANLVGRIEYLYADYGNKTYQIAPGDYYNAAFRAQTLRGALIWKFGP